MTRVSDGQTPDRAGRRHPGPIAPDAFRQARLGRTRSPWRASRAATAFEFWIRWLDPAGGAADRVLSHGGVMRAAGRSGTGRAGGAGRGRDSLVGVHASRRTAFRWRATGDRVTLVAFGFVSTLIVFASDYFRRAARRLEDEEQLRQLAVQELAHP